MDYGRPRGTQLASFIQVRMNQNIGAHYFTEVDLLIVHSITLFHFPWKLKYLRIFEDTNEHYNKARRGEFTGPGCTAIEERVRVVRELFTTNLVEQSMDLEFLSVSFLADAELFFKTKGPTRIWNDLRDLAMTSPVLSSRSTI